MDIGAQLRSSRESKRLSLDALARTIRGQPRVLAAIERNDAGGLPPRPFGRGFVHAYAREVGLNPDQTVRDYFGQFAPLIDVQPDRPAAPVVPSARREVRAPSYALVATLALAVLIVGATVLVRSGKHPPARDASLVGTTGGSAPTAASGDSVAPPATPTRPAQRPPASVAPARPLTVLLQANGPCWVSASADGRRVLYQLLKPGERSTVEANKQITLLAGNAAALTWTINGRDAGAFGASGAVPNGDHHVIERRNHPVAPPPRLSHTTDRNEERTYAQDHEHRVGPKTCAIDHLEEHLLPRVRGELHGFPHERVADPNRVGARLDVAAQRIAKEQRADLDAVDVHDQLPLFEVFLRRAGDRDGRRQHPGRLGEAGATGKNRVEEDRHRRGTREFYQGAGHGRLSTGRGIRRTR